MNNPRVTGLLLLLTGVLTLMGNTMDVLPPQSFWAGLLTYPIGGYLFFMGSRHATERTETHAPRMPGPPRARPGDDSAARPAAHAASPADSAPAPASEPESRIVASLRRPAPAADPAPAAPPAPKPPTEKLALYEMDAEEPDAGDAGSPPSLADQLAKLAKLQQQGIISAEEYAVAKAKLVG